MDIIGDIPTFLNTINNHALSDRDDLWRDLMEHVDNCAIITAIRVRVSDEGKKFMEPPNWIPTGSAVGGKCVYNVVP
jgi:hypothetical protein